MEMHAAVRVDITPLDLVAVVMAQENAHVISFEPVAALICQRL
jgi:hypothetical protein